jgi:hypothetical protein
MRGAARQPFNQAYGRFAKIGKRRGISVSSHDNQSHYLHPHPYPKATPRCPAGIRGTTDQLEAGSVDVELPDGGVICGRHPAG